MKCETLEDKLLELLYEELDGVEKEEAETHLSGCSLCQKKAEGFGLVRRVAQQLPEPVMPSLAYSALLAEAASAAQKFVAPTQPKKVIQDKTPSLWQKFMAGARLLFSPQLAVAASGLLVVAVGYLATQEQGASVGQKSTPMVSEKSAEKSVATPTAATPPIPPAAIAAGESDGDGVGEGGADKKESEQNNTTDEAIALKLMPPTTPIAGKAAPPKTAAPAKPADPAQNIPQEIAAAPAGEAAGSNYLAQARALAEEGKCSDSEKTARNFAAGTESWCQGLQSSALCFQNNKQDTQTRAIYTEMKGFELCASDAQKSLAALDAQQKSQAGGNTDRPTIRSDYKKKDKPSPTPKSPPDKDSAMNPFKSTDKAVSF